MFSSALRIFGQSDALHMWAKLAGAHELRCLDARSATLSLIEHSVNNTTRAGLCSADPADHFRCRTGVIGGCDDRRRAFGMRQNNDTWILRAEQINVIGGKTFMHFAMAFPGDDFYARFVWRHFAPDIHRAA